MKHVPTSTNVHAKTLASAHTARRVHPRFQHQLGPFDPLSRVLAPADYRPASEVRQLTEVCKWRRLVEVAPRWIDKAIKDEGEADVRGLEHWLKALSALSTSDTLCDAK